MRLLLLMLGIVLGTVTFGSGARAQNYPWCVMFGGSESGGTSNCGFSTYEQCMATRSGMGGFCVRNTQYIPPAATHAARARRSRPRVQPQ